MASIPTLLLLLALAYSSEAYKILVVFPFPSKSHSLLGDGIVRHLLSAGHEVTYITPYPKDKTPTKLRQIDISAKTNALFDTLSLTINTIFKKEIDVDDPDAVLDVSLSVAQDVMKHDKIQKLFNDPNETFDVVIAERMFVDLYSGIASVFDTPFIWSFSFENYPVHLSVIDEATNPAVVPSYHFNNIPPYSFYYRVQELWVQARDAYKKMRLERNEEKEAYESIFGPILAKKGRPLPPYSDRMKNVSLVLGNTHPSLGLSVNLPQNYINIGGYHVDSNVKPLPEDLQKIMDNSKHGVVYFSMGSNLMSKDFPEEMKTSLLQMFGQLKQTVLWKFEEKLANMPKNVHILQWAPQPSILAHPNCMVFITHGGLLSTTETVHFGVPIIGIPMFADQFMNVDRAVKRGFAKRVDLTHDIAGDLKIALEEITSNPRYRERVKELSMIYQDRPIPPGKELVHWVEHVVRTRGAPHLRSPALMVPWYQKMFLDLVLLILLSFLIVLRLLKIVKNHFVSKKIENKNSTNKKKNK